MSIFPNLSTRTQMTTHICNIRIHRVLKKGNDLGIHLLPLLDSLFISGRSSIGKISVLKDENVRQDVLPPKGET